MVLFMRARTGSIIAAFLAAIFLTVPLLAQQPTQSQRLDVEDNWRPGLKRIAPADRWQPTVNSPQMENDPFRDTFPVPTSAKVIDGITLTFDGKTYRLKDVSTFSLKEICQDPKGQRLACGALARAKLAEQVYSGFLRCITRSTAADGMLMADCRISGSETIQDLLVREGWAAPLTEAREKFTVALAARCRAGNDRSAKIQLC